MEMTRNNVFSSNRRLLAALKRAGCVLCSVLALKSAGCVLCSVLALKSAGFTLADVQTDVLLPSGSTQPLSSLINCFDVL